MWGWRCRWWREASECGGVQCPMSRQQGSWGPATWAGRARRAGRGLCALCASPYPYTHSPSSLYTLTDTHWDLIRPQVLAQQQVHRRMKWPIECPLLLPSTGARFTQLPRFISLRSLSFSFPLLFTGMLSPSALSCVCMSTQGVLVPINTLGMTSEALSEWFVLFRSGFIPYAFPTTSSLSVFPSVHPPVSLHLPGLSLHPPAYLSIHLAMCLFAFLFRLFQTSLLVGCMYFLIRSNRLIPSF